MKYNINTKIKKWYKEEYGNKIGIEKMSGRTTFMDFLVALTNGEDVYERFNISDSDAVEFILGGLENIVDAPEKYIYDLQFDFDNVNVIPVEKLNYFEVNTGNLIYVYLQRFIDRDGKIKRILHFDFLSPREMAVYNAEAIMLACFETKDIKRKLLIEKLHEEFEKLGYEFFYNKGFDGKTINTTWFFVSEEQLTEIEEQGAAYFFSRSALLSNHCLAK